MGIDAGNEAVLLQYTQDKIVVLDEDGVFQYVNAAAVPLLGYDPDEMVGTSAFEYMHPDDRDRARMTYESVIEREEPTTRTVRHRFQDTDGEWVWFESKFSNVTDETLDGYVVSSRDVTAEVVARREHATAEAHLVELSETVGDVIWMFSGDWNELLFINPAYESVYGGSIEALEADPTTFLDRVHPEDRNPARKAMDRAAGGEPIDIEYRVNPDTDYDTYVRVQGQPIIGDGDVLRIAGFTRDVTDRTRRERQLAVMDNLLRHNLRNDLSIVLGQAEYIASEADEPIADRAEAIQREAHDLLASAEKQRSIIELLTGDSSPYEIDLAAVLENVVGVIQEAHPEATIDLNIVDSCTVFALQEIDAAVTELIHNAIEHHSGSAPEITITMASTEHSCHITVADTCPHIPEEEYRVLTGDRGMSSVYHGSGLGLWLVYWAVDLSDGLITFEHTDDGNAITITLPREEQTDI